MSVHTQYGRSAQVCCSNRQWGLSAIISIYWLSHFPHAMAGHTPTIAFWHLLQGCCRPVLGLSLPMGDVHRPPPPPPPPHTHTHQPLPPTPLLPPPLLSLPSHSLRHRCNNCMQVTVKAACTYRLVLYKCEQVLFVRFYNNPAPLNGSMQFHYCTLVTREPEQTTLLFWSAACGVTPHGLHTADRR